MCLARVALTDVVNRWALVAPFAYLLLLIAHDAVDLGDKLRHSRRHRHGGCNNDVRGS